MVISCFDTEWKKYYRCDTQGGVYRLGGTLNCKVERKLKPETSYQGYRRVTLKFNKNIYRCAVHRLVAMYFIHNFDNKSTVEHKNHIRGDNRLVNLCWFSSVDQHAYRVSNCNEKNIYKKKDARWEVKIYRNKLTYRTYLPKSKTLNDAILLRDKMLSMF